MSMLTSHDETAMIIDVGNWRPQDPGINRSCGNPDIALDRSAVFKEQPSLSSASAIITGASRRLF